MILHIYVYITYTYTPSGNFTDIAIEHHYIYIYLHGVFLTTAYRFWLWRLGRRSRSSRQDLVFKLYDLVLMTVICTVYIYTYMYIYIYISFKQYVYDIICMIHDMYNMGILTLCMYSIFARFLHYYDSYICYRPGFGTQCITSTSPHQSEADGLGTWLLMDFSRSHLKKMLESTEIRDFPWTNHGPWFSKDEFPAFFDIFFL